MLLAFATSPPDTGGKCAKRLPSIGVDRVIIPSLSARSLFAAAVLAISCSATADPNDVAEAFFGHLQDDDYTAAAQLFDLKELRSFRDLMRFIHENVDNPNDELIETLFGVGSTRESVAQLSDAEFFASLLSLVMSETKKSMPFGFSGVEALGYVSEEPDMAHVVTRFNIDLSEGGVSTIDIVSMRLVDGNWGILLQADMKGLANQLKAMYTSGNDG